MDSESGLIEALKRGEEGAYREVVERFSDRLYRIARRVLPEEEEARDVAQATFCTLVEKIGMFEGRSSLFTWLCRIALNEALGRRRRAAKAPMEPIERLLPRYEFGMARGEPADWSALPDKLFEGKEFLEFYHECVRSLPEGLRAAYVLKDMEEMGEGDVCAVLDLTKPAMKNRVHRARLILRKKIEERYAR